MQKGFTLLEILVVIAIVGILAAVAYPSYQEYVIKTRRGDMQSEMMRIAQEAQRYQVVNRRFSGMTLANLNSSGSYPSDTAYYNLAITIPSATTWELTATPIAGTTQANDGTIRLNSRGEKCWQKGASCTLSNTSTW